MNFIWVIWRVMINIFSNKFKTNIDLLNSTLSPANFWSSHLQLLYNREVAAIILLSRGHITRDEHLSWLLLLASGSSQIQLEFDGIIW